LPGAAANLLGDGDLLDPKPQPVAVLSYLLLALLSALWGTSFLLIKLSAGGLDAVSFAFGRLAIGAAALVVASRLLGWRWPRERRVWGALGLLAVIGQAVPIFLLGNAAKLTTSADLALMMGVAPIATMLIARLMGMGEVWNWSAAFGLGLGLLGVAIAVGAPVNPALYPHAGWGRALGLSAAVLYATGALISRFASRNIGPAMSATASMALSASSMGVVWLSVDGAGAPKVFLDAPASVLIALLALGCVNTALAYLVYFRLVETAGATFAGLNNYIVPFIGLALGTGLLGESAPLASWLGLSLVIVGVIITGAATRISKVRS
jgi:drug/metabolite transporter (DMT)-like permease